MDNDSSSCAAAAGAGSAGSGRGDKDASRCTPRDQGPKDFPLPTDNVEGMDDDATPRVAAAGSAPDGPGGDEDDLLPRTPRAQRRESPPPAEDSVEETEADASPAATYFGRGRFNAATSSSSFSVRPRTMVAAPLGFPCTTAPLSPVEEDLLHVVGTEPDLTRVVWPGGDGVPTLTTKAFNDLWTDEWSTDDHLITFFSLYHERHVPRSYAVDTSLYLNQGRNVDLVESLTERVVRDENLLELHHLLVPMSLEGIQWALLVVDVRKERVLYLDSLSDTPNEDALRAVQRRFEAALSEHYSAEDATALALSAWHAMVNEGMPRLRDGHNCGAFVIAYAYRLGQGVPCVFDSRDGRILRHHIALDLFSSLGGS